MRVLLTHQAPTWYKLCCAALAPETQLHQTWSLPSRKTDPVLEE